MDLDRVLYIDQCVVGCSKKEMPPIYPLTFEWQTQNHTFLDRHMSCHLRRLLRRFISTLSFKANQY